MIVRKHKRTFDDEARARHLFWSGHGFMKTHHLSDGRHNLLEALTTDFRLLYLGSLLLSLFGSNVYVYVYRLLTSSPDLPDSE